MAKSKKTEENQQANGYISPETVLNFNKEVRLRHAKLPKILVQMADWVQAYKQASYKYAPERRPLYRVLDEILLDNHLTALKDSRTGRVLGMPAIVYANKKPDYNLSQFFRKSWFTNLCSAYMDAIFYGHSIFQLERLPNNELRVCEIPRENVSPERAMLILDGDFGCKGVDYEPFLQTKSDNWALFEAGKRNDLGLLNKAAPHAIIKKLANQSWGQYLEIFGKPFMVGRIDGINTTFAEQVLEALQSLGSSAIAVMPKNVDLEFLTDTARVGAYELFDKAEERQNSEMSKLICHQTMTFDGGASYSQSETHDQTYDDVTRNDKRNVEMFVNEQVIPVLVRWGVIPSGLYVELNKDIEVSTKEQSDMIIGLLPYFEISPEEIYERLGLEVKPRTQTNPAAVPNPKSN